MTGRAIHGAFVLGLLLFSAIARADYDCFTNSGGILFKATDPVEETARTRVIEGCEENAGTDPSECEQNVNCFAQDNEKNVRSLSISGQSSS